MSRLWMVGDVNGESDQVRLRLKHGDWEVEITCSENKVKDVVDKVLSAVDSASNLENSDLLAKIAQLRNELDELRKAILQGSPSTSVGNGDQVPRSPKSSATCRGLIEILWVEGYLVEERALAEVHEELARRGYNYDKTAVAHALADMVREGILTRIGTMRNFRYLQKRPPALEGSQGA